MKEIILESIRNILLENTFSVEDYLKKINKKREKEKVGGLSFVEPFPEKYFTTYIKKLKESFGSNSKWMRFALECHLIHHDFTLLEIIKMVDRLMLLYKKVEQRINIELLKLWLAEEDEKNGNHYSKKEISLITTHYKDIFAWLKIFKGCYELGEFCQFILKVPSKSQTEKLIKKDVIITGENNDYKLVHPKSHAASCLYGAGTKWCTTRRDDDINFQEHTSDYFLLYLVPKKSTLPKFALQVPHYDDSKMEIWDAKDNQISPKSFRKKYPKLWNDLSTWIWNKHHIAIYNLPEPTNRYLTR